MVLGNGLLGRHLRALLDSIDLDQVTYDEIDHLDFTRTNDVNKLIDFAQRCRVTKIINAAGLSVGMDLNMRKPYQSFENNTLMNLNLIDSFSLAYQKYGFKFKGYYSILTSCAYPAVNQPLTEDLFLCGEPHPTVLAHAYAKRNTFLAGKFAAFERGCPMFGLILNNLYGPRDKFDGTGKIATTLIGKIYDAVQNNAPELVFWGDGTQQRELLYVLDAAYLILQATTSFEDTTLPINLGGGINYEISISSLVNLIATHYGYTGKIIFDTTKPQGQQRKLLDISRMESLKIRPPLLPLASGIKETCDWYKSKVDHNTNDKYLYRYFKIFYAELEQQMLTLG